jgi:hypothetical protein
VDPEEAASGDVDEEVDLRRPVKEARWLSVRQMKRGDDRKSSAVSLPAQLGKWVVLNPRKKRSFRR